MTDDSDDDDDADIQFGLFISVQQMYVAFVKHAKFVTAKTKPQIAFMQNSLIEVFAMDHSTTYQYGFIYIRQMAIHLRNAITMKKKVKETN